MSQKAEGKIHNKKILKPRFTNDKTPFTMKNSLLFSFCILLISLTINSYSQVTDIDGNKYTTIPFVQMTWMAENLRTTRLNDGTPIKMVEGNDEFIAMKEPAFSWYKNDAAIGKKYGALYNWYAVKTGKLCPSGWHVSNDDEWMVFEVWTLGMADDDATNIGDRGTDQGMKLRATTDWNIKNYGVAPSGFAALPGGLRADDGSFIDGNDGSRMSWNMGAYFWTSTEDERNTAIGRSTRGEEKTITRMPFSFSRGHSVRCVKD
jgi:uncharacterized protein (TIGR02145 family)